MRVDQRHDQIFYEEVEHPKDPGKRVVKRRGSTDHMQQADHEELLSTTRAMVAYIRNIPDALSSRTLAQQLAQKKDMLPWMQQLLERSWRLPESLKSHAAVADSGSFSSCRRGRGKTAGTRAVLHRVDTTTSIPFPAFRASWTIWHGTR